MFFEYNWICKAKLHGPSVSAVTLCGMKNGFIAFANSVPWVFSSNVFLIYSVVLETGYSVINKIDIK